MYSELHVFLAVITVVAAIVTVYMYHSIMYAGSLTACIQDVPSNI